MKYNTLAIDKYGRHWGIRKDGLVYPMFETLNSLTMTIDQLSAFFGPLDVREQ